jgi:hypothetical protein
MIGDDLRRIYFVKLVVVVLAFLVVEWSEVVLSFDVFHWIGVLCCGPQIPPGLLGRLGTNSNGSTKEYPY